MESGSGSSISGKNKGKKTDRCRRAWSDPEELVLINLLKDLVANGWKTDNGFRPGYLNKLETEMMKALPGTDLRGMPHINSKITTWKRYHASLVTMLARSGVRFNKTTKMVEATDELYALVVKNDPNAYKICYKYWPLFDDWKEIFGKDRATGDQAEDVMESVNDQINKDNEANAAARNDFNVNFEDLFDDMEVNSNNDVGKSANTSAPSGKKRPSTDGNGNERLLDLLGHFCRSTKKRLDCITRVIGYEADLGKARKEVFTMLGGIPDMTMDEKLDASHLLAKNSQCLEMFMGLPEVARARYIRRLLAGKFGNHI